MRLSFCLRRVVLARAIILGVGVTDLGLGDCFWINILTDERAAADKPEEFWRLTKGCFL